MTDLASGITGWLFVAAALMLWTGWTLLPVRPGKFLQPEIFAAVRARFRPWIWLYRVHLFGHLVTVMALVALATLVQGAPGRALVWPAVAVLAAGAVTAALASAFYYHFGAWGALDTEGKSAAELADFVASLKVPTEYVTCLTRFGRVFFGLGQVVLAAGLLVAGLLPGGLAIAAGVLGLSAIALTMALPDDLHLFRPIFHLDAAWLAAVGIALLLASPAVPA